MFITICLFGYSCIFSNQNRYTIQINKVPKELTEDIMKNILEKEYGENSVKEVCKLYDEKKTTKKYQKAVEISNQLEKLLKNFEKTKQEILEAQQNAKDFETSFITFSNSKYVDQSTKGLPSGLEFFKANSVSFFSDEIIWENYRKSWIEIAIRTSISWSITVVFLLILFGITALAFTIQYAFIFYETLLTQALGFELFKITRETEFVTSLVGVVVNLILVIFLVAMDASIIFLDILTNLEGHKSRLFKNISLTLKYCFFSCIVYWISTLLLSFNLLTAAIVSGGKLSFNFTYEESLVFAYNYLGVVFSVFCQEESFPKDMQLNIEIEKNEFLIAEYFSKSTIFFMMALSYVHMLPISIVISLMYFILDAFLRRFQMIYLFKKGSNDDHSFKILPILFGIFSFGLIVVEYSRFKFGVHAYFHSWDSFSSFFTLFFIGGVCFKWVSFIKNLIGIKKSSENTQDTSFMKIEKRLYKNLDFGSHNVELNDLRNTIAHFWFSDTWTDDNDTKSLTMSNRIT
eukprot:gene605-8109_t